MSDADEQNDVNLPSADTIASALAQLIRGPGDAKNVALALKVARETWLVLRALLNKCVVASISDPQVAVAVEKMIVSDAMTVTESALSPFAVVDGISKYVLPVLVDFVEALEEGNADGVLEDEGKRVSPENN